MTPSSVVMNPLCILRDKSGESDLAVLISVSADSDWLAIRPHGYGEAEAMDGHGDPILLEVWQGELRLLIGTDINDPNKAVVSLDGANEAFREEPGSESHPATAQTEHLGRTESIFAVGLGHASALALQLLTHAVSFHCTPRPEQEFEFAIPSKHRRLLRKLTAHVKPTASPRAESHSHLPRQQHPQDVLSSGEAAVIASDLWNETSSPAPESCRFVVSPFDEPESGIGAVQEPAGRETCWHVQDGRPLPDSRTYRVRYEIDVDAGDPLGAARQAHAYMVSPRSYRPVLEVAPHRTSGEVDFSNAEKFDLHELGCGDDRDNMEQLKLVAEIIESTYPHDANGRRIEGDSPISGADVVERLVALEQPIRDVLHRYSPWPRPKLRLLLESDPHGREYFDHYSHFEAMRAAVRRLVQSSIEHTAQDGIERTVGIAIIPPANPNEEADAPDH